MESDNNRGPPEPSPYESIRTNRMTPEVRTALKQIYVADDDWVYRWGHSSLKKQYCGAKGWGLFATEDVEADRLLVEYTGILEMGTPPPNSQYSLRIHKNFYLDARLFGSRARYANHGCGEKENCVIRLVWQHREPFAYLLSTKFIPAGTEVCFDYGCEVLPQQLYLVCHCGATDCRQVIGARKTFDKRPVEIKCAFCGKVFTRESSLQYHVNIHMGLTPFVCKICGKAFAQPSNLARHVSSHTATSVKPFKCLRCPKSYASKQKLTLHLPKCGIQK